MIDTEGNTPKHGGGLGLDGNGMGSSFPSGIPVTWEVEDDGDD